MENYIIRIYRRDPADPRKLTGIAEVVETEEKKAFRSFDELLDIFSLSGRERKKKWKEPKEGDGHEDGT